MLSLFRKSNLLKYLLVMALSCSFVACAGRQANPVPMNIPGDMTLSARGLKLMMSQVQSQINAKAPKADKTGTNALLGVAGWFLLVPWFFMDFSEADMIELNALRDRYNYLAILYNEKEMQENKIMQMPTYEELANNEELREKFSKQLQDMDSRAADTPQAELSACGSCGQELDPKNRFCPHCGSPR